MKRDVLENTRDGGKKNCEDRWIHENFRRGRPPSDPYHWEVSGWNNKGCGINWSQECKCLDSWFSSLLLIIYIWRLKSWVQAAAQKLYSHRTKTKHSFSSQAALSEAGCAQIISQICLTPRNASIATFFDFQPIFFFFPQYFFPFTRIIPFWNAVIGKQAFV